eukprot:gnl/MRDRNA2_/MRDRNA2_57015_c0_seq1.p1 gnl/MRDRNA2_/MRDRNA2_57015_c0~~gnl/MRDRNA2_/MRDRNA2_57015_c0_seq1.p1  ORF type:complete len:454 (+),score=103.63 gnl/MRDRNA2_/MRDRNA2_57015_c0_seq1:184-1545(+)
MWDESVGHYRRGSIAGVGRHSLYAVRLDAGGVHARVPAARLKCVGKRRTGTAECRANASGQISEFVSADHAQGDLHKKAEKTCEEATSSPLNCNILKPEASFVDSGDPAGDSEDESCSSSSSISSTGQSSVDISSVSDLSEEEANDIPDAEDEEADDFGDEDEEADDSGICDQGFCREKSADQLETSGDVIDRRSSNESDGESDSESDSGETESPSHSNDDWDNSSDSSKSSHQYDDLAARASLNTSGLPEESLSRSNEISSTGPVSVCVEKFETPPYRILNPSKSQHKSVLEPQTPRLRNAKQQVVGQLLCRWWYALPAWPPEDFPYDKELEAHGYRRVQSTEFEFAPDVDSRGLIKAYELIPFQGVYRSARGEIVDVRPEEGKPSYANLMQKPLPELYRLLVKAYNGQLQALQEKAPHNTHLQQELRAAVADVKNRSSFFNYFQSSTSESN